MTNVVVTQTEPIVVFPRLTRIENAANNKSLSGKRRRQMASSPTSSKNYYIPEVTFRKAALLLEPHTYVKRLTESKR